MAAIEIRKAERFRSKLRLAIAGPSGSGKTYGSLLVAKGMSGRVCLIDTERGSGDLYADLTDYDIITLLPPYKPEAYIEAITAAEKDHDIVIVDSLSHAWSDEGGLLDQADKLSARSGNSYTVWKELTPQHRRLVGALLNSPRHIIATMRSKQAYELEEYTDARGNKKSRPVKMGLAPVQREGMEYEFTVFMDVDQQHNARATKDRTAMFRDEVFQLGPDTGKRLLEWLNAGKVDYRAVRERIGKAAQDLGIPMTDKAAFQAAVKERTQLDLSNPENYDEIAARLETLVDEVREAKKAAAATPPPAPAPAPAQPAPKPGEGMF